MVAFDQSILKSSRNKHSQRCWKNQVIRLETWEHLGEADSGSRTSSWLRSAVWPQAGHLTGFYATLTSGASGMSWTRSLPSLRFYGLIWHLEKNRMPFNYSIKIFYHSSWRDVIGGTNATVGVSEVFITSLTIPPVVHLGTLPAKLSVRPQTTPHLTL